MVRTATPSAPVEAKYAALRAGLRDLLRDGLVARARGLDGGAHVDALGALARQRRREHRPHE